MQHWRNSRLGIIVLLGLLASACGATAEPEEEPIATAAEALISVGQPDFSVSQIGYWCSAVYPTAGWTFGYGSPGNENANPCAGNTGATTIRTGMYSATNWNIAEVWCAPNYYWVYEEVGTDALAAAYNAAANTQTEGNCIFRVTPAAAFRQPLTGPTPYLLPAPTPFPIPAATPSYSFNVGQFVSNLETALGAGTPAPVGYQIAVRDPLGNLVESVASGYAVSSNTQSVPETAMTTSQTLDMASVSKTITATAMMAALQDLATQEPGETSLGITLDSSIQPYLPSNWTVPASVSNVTFRMVLEHKAGLCWVPSTICAQGCIPTSGSSCICPSNPGDSYADVQALILQGAQSSEQGVWNYCDGNFALLRVLLPYVVDGPQAYQPFETLGTPAGTLNAEITAMSYRNYVRGRLFAPLGLSALDDFYTGPAPETVYYNGLQQYIPDGINVTGATNPACDTSNPLTRNCGAYNMMADNWSLNAGSGNWTMSAADVSLFVSSLWQGNILSAASLSELIAETAANDPHQSSNVNVGMGNYSTQLTIFDTTAHTDLNHNGGGANGGPSAQWVTFFNGYTAALLSNTAWGFPSEEGYQVFETAAEPSFGPPLYHGWPSPVPGCTTTGWNMTAQTADGGTYPYNSGDSATCRAWKLAATICTTQPTGYGYSPPGDFSCPSSGGFTDPTLGTFCSVSNQYSCSDCYGACNAACIYMPLSLRNCSDIEEDQN